MSKNISVMWVYLKDVEIDIRLVESILEPLEEIIVDKFGGMLNDR